MNCLFSCLTNSFNYKTKRMKTRFYFVRFAVTMMLFLAMPVTSLAFEYTINFTASGVSSSYDSVVVRNLNKGLSLTIYPGNVLILSDQISSVGQVMADPESMQIFPNPIIDQATIFFLAKNAGKASIDVFSLDGKKLAEVSKEVNKGTNTFRLSLPGGTYLIQVTGPGYSYSAKAISKAGFATAPVIAGTQAPPLSPVPIGGYMPFASGDQILYQAYSGDNSTVVTDSPTGNKNQDFEFVICRDADGNGYPVIKIGNQWWMARNLNATKFRNGENIPYVSDVYEWKGAYQSPAMCNNYDNAEYGQIYGKLYNWNAVNDSRGLAPVGWHVATHAEWTALKDHTDSHWSFIVNVPKALASHDYWKTSTVEGAVGNNLLLNNFTGFSALPGGDRGGTNGTYFNIGEVGFWWTSTEYSISNAWYWYFSFDVSYIVWDNNTKRFGMSVRCVKDAISPP